MIADKRLVIGIEIVVMILIAVYGFLNTCNSPILLVTFIFYSFTYLMVTTLNVDMDERKSLLIGIVTELILTFVVLSLNNIG